MSTPADTPSSRSPLQGGGAALAWLWVAVPFAWGVYELFVKIPALFG